MIKVIKLKENINLIYFVNLCGKLSVLCGNMKLNTVNTKKTQSFAEKKYKNETGNTGIG